MAHTVGMDAAWLTCPAYCLRDDASREAALAAARAVCPLPVHASPLLDLRLGEGAWASAAQRNADFAIGLRHSILIAARGGYGCVDLIAQVLAHGGPWPRVVGYSDVTALHAAFWVRGQRNGIYGFCPAVAHGPRTVHSTRALFAAEPVAFDAAISVHPGSAEGPCFAACLRVLAGLAGTAAQPDLRGCVLCLEDIDERPYRVDRDLWQLQHAGMLRGVAGLVFGCFPGELPAAYAGPSHQEVQRAWAQRLGIPAVSGVPFGHDPDPIALPMGGAAQLSAQPDRAHVRWHPGA